MSSSPSLPKVTGARTWVLRIPQPEGHRTRPDAVNEFVGIDVETDGSTTGMGFTWTVIPGSGGVIKALLDRVMIPEIVGRRINEQRAIARQLAKWTDRLGSAGINSMAIAAIDIALWDAQARALEVPLATLLGATRDRVPTYSSGRYSPLLSTAQTLEQVESGLAQGFTSVKLRVGVDPDGDIERISAVRERFGSGLRIMCDANMRLDVATALQMGRRLEHLDVFWFEEPLPSTHLEGYAYLNDRLRIPISTGEHAFTLGEFVQILDRGAASIVQPDICMVRGVTELLDIAHMAGARGFAVAPHCVPEVTVHAAAAAPEVIYIESFPMLDPVLEHPLRVEEGHVVVPDRPGHGLNLHPEAWESFGVTDEAAPS